MALPTKTELLEFIQSATHKVGKREIARAFNIRGAARTELKRLLREMRNEGLLAGTRKNLQQPGTLPPVTVIEITGRDDHGDYYALPLKWPVGDDTAPPRILVLDQARKGGRDQLPGIGDRVLARIDEMPDAEASGYRYHARPIKRLARDRTTLLGIFRRLGDGSGVIDPVDRKRLTEWVVEARDIMEAQSGELVRFEILKTRRHGPPRAKVLERLGNPESQRQVSLIAIHRHGLPNAFSEELMRDVAKLRPATSKARDDLRDMPLITIDPEDARDHDDAVWASPDDDPDNKGGFIVMVAIADVAHYVRANTLIDREALKRGNSAYFPDRVVPMLPERISNDLCSLREGEDRACLAVRMIFDKNGHKKHHAFLRGLMRSAAKLSYEQAQTAIDGQPDEKAAALMEATLQPLWAAYRTVAKAREERQPLALDLPERKIRLDDQGRVKDILTPERLTAHKLVEEFMIQANVAAAETLEAKKARFIYRVHDAPSKEKLLALSDFLRTLDINLPRAGRLQPRQFNQILALVKGRDMEELVNEVILRSQSQAEYNPDNAGHFGLNLRRYAHFTSPIRRYADLVVHRALIGALGLGGDGLTAPEIDRLPQIAEAISDTERRAMAAERETNDRLIAAHLADRIGATFAARISGVTRVGLFVRLAATGADGFVPVSTIGDEFYVHDDKRQALIGENSGEMYRLGASVEVRLVEAIPTAGALRFEMLSAGVKSSGVKAARRQTRRGRGPKHGARKRRGRPRR